MDDIKKIDGNMFKMIIKNGTIQLKNQYQHINDLNVFPVPDGDTGTNMRSTMISGLESIENIDDDSIEVMGKALSRGLLMGARGNSGVILSQLFSGFAKAFEKKETINALAFVDGFEKGVIQAYGAVANPVEGTILTVAREAIQKVRSSATEDSTIVEVLETYLDEAKKSLSRTPDLLPQLKEAGVVDSGALGLITIVEGMLLGLKGEFVEEREIKYSTEHIHANEENTEFGYCTEFIVELKNPDIFNQFQFKKDLEKLGDSIVLVVNDDICKVHIHTITPGEALNLGQKYGEFLKLKIDNMTVQNKELKAERSEKKHLGIITTANGPGLKNLFKELQVDYIVDGGQTDNPSIEDFVKAIEKVNADNILIIPNNKNILLSAEIAAKQVEDKNVIVIPAKTIPQGYVSLLMADRSQDIETIVDEMKDAIGNVKTGEITRAVRDTKINGLAVKKDDYIGIQNGELVSAQFKRIDALKSTIASMIKENNEIITIMTGKDSDKIEIKEIKKYISQNYSNIELEIVDGGQAIYDYIISVE